MAAHEFQDFVENRHGTLIRIGPVSHFGRLRFGRLLGLQSRLRQNRWSGWFRRARRILENRAIFGRGHRISDPRRLRPSVSPGTRPRPCIRTRQRVHHLGPWGFHPLVRHPWGCRKRCRGGRRKRRWSWRRKRMFCVHAPTFADINHSHPSAGGATEPIAARPRRCGERPGPNREATDSTGGATDSTGGATGSTGGATGSTGGATGSTGGATDATGGATDAMGERPVPQWVPPIQRAAPVSCPTLRQTQRLHRL